MIQIELDQDDAMVIREYYKARYGYGYAIVNINRLAEIHMFYSHVIATLIVRRICQ